MREQRKWIRSRKIRGTEKELKSDKIKYNHYLKKKYEAELEYLRVNFEDEGIEHLKMFYNDTIQRYPFLQGVIKGICPKAFEPANELQSAIIHQYETREIGNETLAARLNALDLKNCYDYKNKKKIPYEEPTV
jgi:hypothetical protein